MLIDWLNIYRLLFVEFGANFFVMGGGGGSDWLNCLGGECPQFE